MPKPQLSLKNIDAHSDLSASHCVVPISLGQRYHNGLIFKRSLELLSARFSQITIVVADLLQIHTRKIYHLSKSSSDSKEIEQEIEQEILNESEKCRRRSGKQS